MAKREKSARVIFEDNNGGDVIEITDWRDGKYTLKIGQCCVWVIDITGTVSEICKGVVDKVSGGK